MNLFFIFGAKYLFLLSGIIGLYGFWKLSKENKRSIVILTLLSFPLMYIAAKLGGWLYADPRPFVVGHFAPLIPHEADNGFPSDHTLLTSAIAAVFYPYNKRISIMLWLIALLVGISRVYAGVHHPIDIVGSMLISILCVGLVSSLKLSGRLFRR